MTNNRRIELLEELVSELGISLQLIHHEIGNKTIISDALQKDLDVVADRVEQITSQLSSLKDEGENQINDRCLKCGNTWHHEDDACPNCGSKDIEDYSPKNQPIEGEKVSTDKRQELDKWIKEVKDLLQAISGWSQNYSSTFHKMRAKRLLSELAALESEPAKEQKHKWDGRPNPEDVNPYKARKMKPLE